MDGIELNQDDQGRPRAVGAARGDRHLRGEEADRQRGVDAGADAYMVKRSFDQQALLETVERLTGR